MCVRVRVRARVTERGTFITMAELVVDGASRRATGRTRTVRLIALEIRFVKPAPARVDAAPCTIDVPYHTTGFLLSSIPPVSGSSFAPDAASAAGMPMARSSLTARHSGRYLPRFMNS